MNKKGALTNVAASVRDRLKKISVETGQDFNTLLTRYAIERLLFRRQHQSTGNDLCSKVP